MTLRQFAGVVELRTKVVSLSTLALAALYVLSRKFALPPLPLALACAAALCVDMGTTAFNSFFDAWRGLDHKATNLEADKVLVHEGVPAFAALLAGLALYALAAFLGVALAVMSGFWVVLAGLASMLAGFLYSGGPFPISRTALGEVVADGFLGSFLFIIEFRIVAGFVDGESILASLPSALMIGSILAVNNACDRVEDGKSGRLTLAILLGPRLAFLPAPFLAASSFCLVPLLAWRGVLPWTTAIGAAAALPAAVVQAAGMARRGFSPVTKSRNMAAILRVLLAWSLGLAAGFLADIAF